MAEFTPQDELDYMNSISGAWEAADLFLKQDQGYLTRHGSQRLSIPSIQLNRDQQTLEIWMRSLRQNATVLRSVVEDSQFNADGDDGSLVVFVQRLTASRNLDKGRRTDEQMLHSMMRDHAITPATANFMGITQRVYRARARGNMGSEIWPSLHSLVEITTRLHASRLA
jgi:hypothetical protein